MVAARLWIAALSAFALTNCYSSPSVIDNPDAPPDALEDAVTDGSPDGLSDGMPDGTPDADPDAPCQDMCTDSNTLLTCPGTLTNCEHGCSSANGPHCREMILTNGVHALLTAGLANWSPICGGDLTFSSTGQIMDGAVELRPAGTGVENGIGFYTTLGTPTYTFNSIKLQGCTIVQTSTAVTTLVAAETVELKSGAVIGSALSSQLQQIGTCAPGQASNGYAGGGGGGGTVGGNGAGSPGGAGGGVCANALTPLRTGSSGGAGTPSGPAVMDYGQPGQAGGALQISALGTVTVNNVSFQFGGGGGGRGKMGAPAGGGGSGGTLLLEGRSVSVSDSEFYANGGNGGYAQTVGDPGLNGVGPSASDGGEGRGGTASNAPGNGTLNSSVYTGGGGAVGFIRINSFLTSVTTSSSSPAYTSGQPPVE